MPKSKKRNGAKQYIAPQRITLADATADQQRQYMWGNKTPACDICQTPTRLATDEEFQQYKSNMPGYQLKFTFISECKCS